MKNLLQMLQNNGYPFSKKRLAIVSSLVLILVVLILLLWPQPNFRQYSPTDTGMVARDNFGILYGSDLLGFNGMSFYKADTAADGAVTVISKSAKLPKPSRVFWATDKGALLNFEESFTGTIVENALFQNGQSITKFTELYSWYFDFSTGTIHKVSDAPLLANGAVYSKEDNGFYYMPDYSPFGPYEDLDYPVESSPLYFYSIDKKANELISTDLQLTDVSHINQCPNVPQSVCIIARDKSNTREKKLYKVTKLNMSVLLSSSGKIFPTNRPEYYIVAEAAEKSSGEEEIIDYTSMTAKLHDIRDELSIPFDFEIGADDVVTYIHDDNHFYMLNAHDESRYRSGEIKKNRIRSQKHTLLTNDGLAYQEKLTTYVSYGNKGMVLIATQNNDQIILSPSDMKPVVLDVSQEEAQKVVTNCTELHAQQNDYAESLDMFRVFFTEDSTFNSSLTSLGDCISKQNNTVLSTYNFYIGLLDPRNGKITSD